MEANPLTDNTMSESHEEEAAIQERIEKIGSTFESQDYETAVGDFTAAVNEWTRQGRTDTAVELAEKVSVYRDKVPEELRGSFDIKLGQATFYAGNAENGLLQEAESYYQRVADTKLPELPEDVEKMSEEEKRPFSENFHAHDMLANAAFAGGNFSKAGLLFLEANTERGNFEEPGPRACALYGEAASAFAQGDTETCMAKIGEAQDQLVGIEADETLLVPAIENLKYAAGRVEKLTDEERSNIMPRIVEKIIERGGANGGVKRTNFREVFDIAMLEVQEGDNLE